jgi:hypothetical protein
MQRRHVVMDVGRATTNFDGDLMEKGTSIQEIFES